MSEGSIVKRIGIIVLSIGVLIIGLAGLINFMANNVGDIESSGLEKNEHTENWLFYTGIGTMILGGIILVLRMNKKDEKKSMKAFNKHIREKNRLNI